MQSSDLWRAWSKVVLAPVADGRKSLLDQCRQRLKQNSKLPVARGSNSDIDVCSDAIKSQSSTSESAGPGCLLRRRPRTDIVPGTACVVCPPPLSTAHVGGVIVLWGQRG